MKLYLNKILEERNMSVNQLHKLTGISRTTLDPLNKVNTVPGKTRMETLQKIADELEIELSELISFDNDFEIDKLDIIPIDSFQYLNDYYWLKVYPKDQCIKPYLLTLILYLDFSGSVKAKFPLEIYDTVQEINDYEMRKNKFLKTNFYDEKILLSIEINDGFYNFSDYDSEEFILKNKDELNFQQLYSILDRSFSEKLVNKIIEQLPLFEIKTEKQFSSVPVPKQEEKNAIDIIINATNIRHSSEKKIVTGTMYRKEQSILFQ